jgi:hypothetical protein
VSAGCSLIIVLARSPLSIEDFTVIRSLVCLFRSRGKSITASIRCHDGRRVASPISELNPGAPASGRLCPRSDTAKPPPRRMQEYEPPEHYRICGAANTANQPVKPAQQPAKVAGAPKGRSQSQLTIPAVLLISYLYRSVGDGTTRSCAVLALRRRRRSAHVGGMDLRRVGGLRRCDR